MLYLWLCCRWKFATFGSGAQGEICWTSFSASPDTRAEGAPVTTEAAHLSSTSLKKLRPYLLILWCCRMCKGLFQCWVGGAASGVRHLPGNWCQPESYWTPWTRVVMLCPGSPALPAVLSSAAWPTPACWETAKIHYFIPTWRCCIWQNVNRCLWLNYAHTIIALKMAGFVLDVSIQS